MTTNDRRPGGNPIEFLDAPEPDDDSTHRATLLPIASNHGLRAPGVVGALVLLGSISVIVAQFFDQFSVTFPAPDQAGDSVLQRVAFGVDGFGRIHLFADSVDFSPAGNSPRLGLPALVAAATLLLGTGFALLRRRPIAHRARTVAALLTGVVAGCLISVSLVASDNSNGSWSFEAGWWLYAAGTACLVLACVAAMPLRKSVVELPSSVSAMS